MIAATLLAAELPRAGVGGGGRGAKSTHRRVFANYQISKKSRAALASAWGTEMDEAGARSFAIDYATPCPRLGL